MDFNAPLPDATTTSPADWTYISEGGATIVFSYVGPSNSDFDGMVLRLRKATPVQPAELKDLNQVTDDPDDPSIAFQHKCMARLIPPEHLPRLETVRVSGEWLEALEKFHTHERPAERQEQGGIDSTKKKGVIATDLVGGNCIAVEIKPKWSFLPNTSYLSQGKEVMKSRTCRYCMHSSMRSANGTSYIIKYCPLDLFSPDPARVRLALHALYDIWIQSEGSVNNLKVFVRGEKIDVHERKSMLKNPDENISDVDLRELFTSTILPLLINTPVLRILNRLQRTLDILDIEGLSKLWNQSHSESPSILGSGICDPTLTEWSTFIDEYLSSLGRFDPKTTDLNHYLLAYLLSATFKDCSIMIKLDLLDVNKSPDDSPVNPQKVKVIDLDPKSVNKLEKWEKLDEEIVTAYEHVEEMERRHCIDDGWVEEDATSTSPMSWLAS